MQLNREMGPVWTLILYRGNINGHNIYTQIIKLLQVSGSSSIEKKMGKFNILATVGTRIVIRSCNDWLIGDPMFKQLTFSYNLQAVGKYF